MKGMLQAALLVVKVLSDNKNRSASEVRHAFSKHGANMAEQGAVSRMFQRRGQIMVAKEGRGGSAYGAGFRVRSR